MYRNTAAFALGEIVIHEGHRYRGVVVDVDPTFQGPEEWYQSLEASRPPKEQPWYSVLVDNTDQMAYVAEQSLEPDHSEDPVTNPALDSFVAGMKGGRYEVYQTLN